MPPDRLPRKVLYGQLHHGRRSAGGQNRRYKDQLKEKLRKELNIRRERVIRRCSLSRQLSVPDNYLFQRYRFTSQSIIYIRNLIRPYMCNITNRSLSHPSRYCVLHCVSLQMFFVQCRRCRGNCIQSNSHLIFTLQCKT
ncbi:hypothetical protein N1851_028411 [Merluccius polli]|uniref:Uncharacterized protein n=1 Tax=Merluccius polli TaxID=89951 RepID=A0AA47M8N1_MERPO|nr:hypothetical protein N1851_028411 [Merluccius polli]